MTDHADARVLAYASEILPIYRQSHNEYVRFCECAAKVLLLDVTEMDIRDFELTAARLEATMIELQKVVRRTWEAKRKLDEGLNAEAA